jgi:hypothetical protein
MRKDNDTISNTMAKLAGQTIFNAGTSEGVKKAWETRKGLHPNEIASAAGASYAGESKNKYGATVHTYHVDVPENDKYGDSISRAEESARQHMMKQGMTGLGGGMEGSMKTMEKSVIEPGDMMKETRHRFIAKPSQNVDAAEKHAYGRAPGQ